MQRQVLRQRPERRSAQIQPQAQRRVTALVLLRYPPSLYPRPHQSSIVEGRAKEVPAGVGADALVISQEEVHVVLAEVFV